MAKKNGDPEYSNLVPPFGTINFTMDFKSLYKHYYNQLTYICFRLLVFDGLPDTIEETYLKYCIFNLGKVVFFKLDQDIIENRQSFITPLKPGDLVCQSGNNAEVQTFYYLYRNVIVNNSALSKTYDLKPGKNCEIVYCTEPDKYKAFGSGGLHVLIARTATILADNDLSINIIQKNTRLTNVLGADDEPTKRSAEAAVNAMYNGDPYIVAQKSLVSDLSSFPMTQTTANKDIVQLIEARQYIYSHFYEALGLQTHDNMKKERLITEEINDNEELSALNIDDILVTVQAGLDRVNAMFDTNISVSLNPIIKKAHETDETEPADDREDLTDAAAGTAAGTEEPREDQTADAAEQDEPADDQTEDAAEQEEPQIEINVTAEDNAEVSIEINQNGGDNDVRNPDPLA